MRLAVMVVVTYLAVVIQTSVCPSLGLGRAAPELLGLEAFAVVLTSSSPYAFLWAGWIGLVHDLASTGRLGIAMACFAITAYLLSILRKHIYVHHPLVQSLVILASVLVSLTGLVTVRALLGETGQPWSDLLSVVVVTAVSTAIAALPVLVLIRRWTTTDFARD